MPDFAAVTWRGGVRSDFYALELRNQADAKLLSMSMTLMAIELVHEAEKPSRIYHPVQLRDRDLSAGVNTEPRTAELSSIEERSQEFEAENDREVDLRKIAEGARLVSGERDFSVKVAVSL